MNWLEQVDNYCERLGPGLLAEPLNLVSNLAFLLAAALVWRRTRPDGLARALALILFIIGLGSLAFHGFAQRWAALADVLPILAFILVYIYAATTRYLHQTWWLGLVVTLAFIPFAMLLGRGMAALFGPLNGSVSYMPVLAMILAYAALLARKAPATARGLAIGAGILALSLTFRTLDAPLCAAAPIGLHFMWHILNAIMLGWMILVLLRHPRLAPLAR
ncbi:ceramidase [Abyssibius alkaniclasticus]|uniref:ceramidase domain-containing protein n=1 Tax=Abyssibius alkaniclasticus TaxID=2881234 RepID=UPI002363484A|nr:ceramidase domain-containing protein [Abyssibius alkaniclasticus]UPH69910.1 ceramidase [Abyssibius alkaniclasticus]